MKEAVCITRSVYFFVTLTLTNTSAQAREWRTTAAEVTRIQEPVAVADRATMVMALGKGRAARPVVRSTTQSITTGRAATDSKVRERAL